MKKLLLPSLIIFLALFFRLYRLEERYRFEWDQADDATKATEILRGKLRLIGPQVANENSFFVGPQHYYLLAPFYFIGQGHPYSGAALSIFIGTLASLLPYFLFSGLLSLPVALLSSLFLAVNPDLISWNAIYGPIFSFLVFFFCLKILDRTISQRQLRLLFLLLGFAATTHLANAILVLPLLITLSIRRPKLNPFFALFLFFIPFLPLLVFDLRHQYLNFRQLINTLTSSTNIPYPNSFQVFWRSLVIYHWPLPPVLQSLVNLTVVLVSSVLLRHRIAPWFSLFWFFAPVILLFFYHRQISEYYFASSLILVPLGLSTLISRFFSPKTIPFLFLVLLILQFQKIHQNTEITLKNKMKIIDCLHRQTHQQPFFLSYDLPLGLNFGYDYLLKYSGLADSLHPSSQLYTISQSFSDPNAKLICQSGPLLLIKK